MAAVDYTNIQNQIEDVLKNDSRLEGVGVFVEEEPHLGVADRTSTIVVFMEGRDALAVEQPAAAGKRTRYRVRASLIVVSFSFESYRKASELRNTVLGNLELVLMDNRTFNGAVDASWLEGGDMETAKDSKSSIWIAAAETVLTMQVSAIS